MDSFEKEELDKFIESSAQVFKMMAEISGDLKEYFDGYRDGIVLISDKIGSLISKRIEDGEDYTPEEMLDHLKIVSENMRKMIPK